ncbi:decarboxylase [Streptomyces griseoflavus]|uniref:decarboxylase n=1 Tax=Streptomyces griseoflavus TaxID=35619 RepID=UPI0037F9ED30
MDDQGGPTTLAPGPASVNTGIPPIRCARPRGGAGAGPDVSFTGRALTGPTRLLLKVTHRAVVDLARRAADGLTRGPDALFPSRTGLPAHEAAPRPEAEPRIPAISANQVTMWAALRRLGTRAVGPYQALIDASARSGTVPPGRASGPVPPDVPEEKQQEGWT